MKAKQILFFGMFMWSSMALMAQGPGGDFHQKSEKINALKVEFLTTKLELTPAEAEKFWPLYNEFIDKMQTIHRTRRKKMKANKGKDLSDAEVNALIAYNFDTDQKLLDLKREYDKKFKSVLPVQKVGKLYLAEEQFKRELLRKMKGHQQGGRNGMGEPPK